MSANGPAPPAESSAKRIPNSDASRYTKQYFGIEAIKLVIRIFNHENYMKPNTQGAPICTIQRITFDHLASTLDNL